MRPKVLHVSAARLSSGGVERFLLGLCSGLRQDFKFALLSGADESFSGTIRDMGCFTYLWDVRGAFDASAARVLSAAVDLYHPDIVHIHDARAGMLSRLHLKRGPRIIYTAHLPPYYYRWEKFTGLRRFLYGSIERILNTLKTDAVIYPSRRGWEDALHHRYAPASKAVCIPNGIDLRPFENAPARTETRTSVICTVARLSPEKNVGLLLEAAAMLKQRGRDFALWIVGDGPQRADLERRASELGVASLTRFWGQSDDVASLLFQSDIFALSSWYEGGRSQSVMEAQAAGLPCVLSDVGDHVSMLDNGSGWLFPEGDAAACASRLEALLTDPRSRLEMGRRARERAVQSYSLEVMADAYRRVYDSLLEKPSL